MRERERYIYIYIYILHYRKDPKLWELLIVYFTLITLNPKLSTVNPKLFETNQGIDSAKPLSQDSAPPPPQKIEVREGFFFEGLLPSAKVLVRGLGFRVSVQLNPTPQGSGGAFAAAFAGFCKLEKKDYLNLAKPTFL